MGHLVMTCVKLLWPISGDKLVSFEIFC